MLAGPIDRQLRLFSHFGSISSDGLAASALVVASCVLRALPEAFSLAGCRSPCTSFISAWSVFSMASRRLSRVSPPGGAFCEFGCVSCANDQLAAIIVPAIRANRIGGRRRERVGVWDI